MCQDGETGKVHLNIGDIDDKRQLIQPSPCSIDGHSVVSPEDSSKEAVIANLLNDNDIMPQKYHDRDKDLQLDSKEEEDVPYIPEVVEQHHAAVEEVGGSHHNHHGDDGVFDLPPIHDLEHHAHHEHEDHHHHHAPLHGHGEYIHEAKTHAEEGGLYTSNNTLNSLYNEHLYLLSTFYIPHFKAN